MADTMSDNSAPVSAPRLSFIEAQVVRIPHTYVNTASGGMAGAVSAIVSCPLDVIKTKLQAQGGWQIKDGSLPSRRIAYRGIRGTALSVWADDGLKGFYRGLGPLLLGYVPTWAVYLTIYNRTQEYFLQRPELGYSSFAANFYASLCGGITSTTLTNPIWVIKTRLMSQENVQHSSRIPWHYNNTLDAIRKMYRYEGLRSFYSGLTPALLGLTHVAVQFPLYEIFKAKFTGIESGRIATAEERANNFWGLAAAVFLSKVIASTATYPHEVVRTRLQTQQRTPGHEPLVGAGTGVNPTDLGRPVGSPAGGTAGTGAAEMAARLKAEAQRLKIEPPRIRGTIETCKTIFRKEGWRGFYAGLGTNLLRAVPSAMTTLLTYEYLKKAILTTQEQARTKMAEDGS